VRIPLAQREALLDAFERSGLSGLKFTGLPAGISVQITITARLTNGAVTAPRQKRYPTPTPADQPLGSKLK